MLVAGMVACGSHPQGILLSSPDGRLQITLQVNGPGRLHYAVDRAGEEVILPSPLGMLLGTGDTLGGHVLCLEASPASLRDTTWHPVWGERASYRDRYRVMIVDVEERSGCRWQLELRAYDEGVAFRYLLPQAVAGGDSVYILRERTGFVFPRGSQAWVTYSAQGIYRRMDVDSIRRPAERPLVVEEPAGTYVAVGEAALVDYARMRLSKGEEPGGVVAHLAGPVALHVPAHSPWRYIMVASSPGRLVENNYLLLNLNEPCALDDVSWIGPGKVIREITLTTRGGKACVDFAARHGLQFVEFDAGWYGHEYDDASDATTVTVDPRRSPGPLDLKEVIRYAREKNIGIILYVNRRALERQLDTLLPLYASWGVSGVKYGFVQVGPQRWTAWLHTAIRKAAAHHLMVDVHDEYRPTGYQRTWPNFMTCEGIRGDEAAPDNHHTLITMFTRAIAGPADNTVCYFSDRVVTEMHSSHATQLAKAVCIFSPWQFLFWYDRPAASRKGPAAPELPGNRVISEVPELEFFKEVPTVWDETRVIEGKIGEYGTVARRAGDDWYVGAINGRESHQLVLPLSFLEAGKQYMAQIYRDDPLVETRTHVRVEERQVTSADTLRFELAPNTGMAMRLAGSR